MTFAQFSGTPALKRRHVPIRCYRPSLRCRSRGAAAPARVTGAGGSLVTLKADDRRFMRGPVHALVGDDEPVGEVRLERRERLEVQVGERVALDVFHARFGLAFGPRAMGRAGPGLHVPVPAEREVRG